MSVAIAGILAGVAIAALAHWQLARQLDRIAAERASWAHERWELNTRLQAPELMRSAPPSPPAIIEAAAEAVVEGEDKKPEPTDQFHLVGVAA